MPKLLVIHGAGMNMRGKTQLDIFGPMKLPEYDQHIRQYAVEHGFDEIGFADRNPAARDEQI